MLLILVDVFIIFIIAAGRALAGNGESGINDITDTPNETIEVAEGVNIHDHKDHTILRIDHRINTRIEYRSL